MTHSIEHTHTHTHLLQVINEYNTLHLLKQHLSVSLVIHLQHVKLGDFLVMQPQKDVLNVLKPFPLQILVRNQNYGGFDRSIWKARTNDGHRVAALKIKHARTQTEKLKLKYSEGIQFGELTRLSYFDSITFFAIDPMHNLWLGAAKHMLKVMEVIGYLNSRKIVMYTVL